MNSSEGEFHEGVIRAATKDFGIKQCPDMTSWVRNLTYSVNYDNNHERQCYVFFRFLRGRQGHLLFLGFFQSSDQLVSGKGQYDQRNYGKNHEVTDQVIKDIIYIIIAPFCFFGKISPDVLKINYIISKIEW